MAQRMTRVSVQVARMPASHDRALEALSRRGRLRSLEERRGLDFASNDYLGLAESDALKAAVLEAVARGVPVGAGGSRLLRGNHAEHETLEVEAAHHFHSDAALFFGGGFIANTAIFSTLPARGDTIFYDELIHASAHEGMRLSKADAIAVRHNSPDAFEDAIKLWRQRNSGGTPWIAVESLYSMDGDCAPINALADIAKRYDAMLVIDEAHATGVFGPQGRGLAAHLEDQPNVITVHTCGKALGCMGALVLCSQQTKQFLINRARAFIYATAPSPLVASCVRAALKISHDADDRRAALKARMVATRDMLSKQTAFTPSQTHIQPLIVGNDARAVALASALQNRGFDIRAIRPPTVPDGTARLRLTITLNTSLADIEALIGAIASAQAELAA